MTQRVSIHVIDISQQMFAKVYNRKDPCPLGLPTGQVGVRPDHRPDQIVDAIKKAAKGNPVMYLRVLAHGNSDWCDIPSIQNEFEVAPRYSRLLKEKIVHPSCKLLIHSCGVASDTSVLRYGADPRNPKPGDEIPGQFAGRSETGKGLRFMKRLASVFGINTIGPIDIQHLSVEGPWGFKGNTVSVKPGGSFVVQSGLGRGAWDPIGLEIEARRYLFNIQKQFIDKNSLTVARVQLRNLIKLYPNTPTAWIADQMLKSPLLVWDTDEL